MAASLVSSQVHIAYSRCSPEHYLVPPAVMISSDGGENFGSPAVLKEIQAGTVEGLAYQLGGGANNSLVFDAEWRADPGYPNIEAGFPAALASAPVSSPPVVDLDGDGRTEIVLLSLEELVVGVNEVPDSPGETWGMARRDTQRTGCADCPEDLTMGVSDDGTTTVTRVRFAPPTPSPGPGPQRFAFALPVHARVRLDVYDLRGALVRKLVIAR